MLIEGLSNTNTSKIAVGGLREVISRIRDWWKKRQAWKEWRQENMDEWARNNGIVSVMAYHVFEEEYTEEGEMQ